MKQEELNKSIIRNFYRRTVSQGDLAYAEEIIADDYVQHSPLVKPGKAGLMDALRYMKQMPKPATTSTPFMRLIAEGDYVVTNLSFGWDGKQKVVVDVFRFQNSKVTEHWDAIEDQPDFTVNGHAMLDGGMPVDAVGLTASNKKVVEEFFQRIFIRRQLDALVNFVAPDLIQHNPEVANGLTGLMNYLQHQSADVSIETIGLIIGEGDFVVVQSQGKQGQKPTTFYDIFRLTDRKIVEHWHVKQG